MYYHWMNVHVRFVTMLGHINAAQVPSLNQQQIQYQKPRNACMVRRISIYELLHV